MGHVMMLPDRGRVNLKERAFQVGLTAENIARILGMPENLAAEALEHHGVDLPDNVFEAIDELVWERVEIEFQSRGQIPPMKPDFDPDRFRSGVPYGGSLVYSYKKPKKISDMVLKTDTRDFWRKVHHLASVLGEKPWTVWKLPAEEKKRLFKKHGIE